MNDLVDTTEMYLRTIYDLEEEGVTPLRARIAERLEQSGPTVSQTVSRMERDGLLHVAGDRHLELTDKGRSLAIAVMRKHRLAERLLVDVIGLPWEEVHAEACRWEHVMSEDVERRLVKVLDHPTTSPFGNPIPGLFDLGVARSSGRRCQPGSVDRAAVRIAGRGRRPPAHRARPGRHRPDHSAQRRRRGAQRPGHGGDRPGRRGDHRYPRPRKRHPAARDGARGQSRKGLTAATRSAASLRACRTLVAAAIAPRVARPLDIRCSQVRESRSGRMPDCSAYPACRPSGGVGRNAAPPPATPRPAVRHRERKR